jgi:hypothetical protein
VAAVAVIGIVAMGSRPAGPIANIRRTGNYYGSYSWAFQLD